MAIDLTLFQQGMPFAGDVEGALAALRQRLARAQLSQIVHQRRVLIVIEGSDGAGKRDFVKLLGAALDPTHFAVTSVAPDRRRSSDGHWLARFWAALPDAGDTAIFYHSWYRRVLEDKVLGQVTDKEWKRAFDEINEFEAQQRDYGTAVVKLLFHVTDAIQDRRLAERQSDVWLRHLIGAEELRVPTARAAYRAALTQALAQTDTRWAPWSIVDANDAAAAQIAGLTAIADMLDKALPKEPPATDTPAKPFVPSETAQPAG